MGRRREYQRQEHIYQKGRGKEEQQQSGSRVMKTIRRRARGVYFILFIEVREKRRHSVMRRRERENTEREEDGSSVGSEVGCEPNRQEKKRKKTDGTH